MDKRDIIEAVALRKARYCRFIDTKRWDEFAALLHQAPQILIHCPGAVRSRQGLIQRPNGSR